MSQKVQFVAAVVSQPELLILDEPFSGLDPVNAESLKDAVLEMRRRGATVVFSTHDMATAEKMCDRIFMIFKGRKVLDGTLHDIQAQYGFDTVRLRTSAGAGALSGITGVDAVNDYGQLQEVRLSCDAQQFLQQLAAKTAVHHFEITRPSLHDIFVRIARPSENRSDGMKNKTLIVALSEFTTLTKSKAFLIGILMMPVFMGIAFAVQKSRATPPTSRIGTSSSSIGPASSTVRSPRPPRNGTAAVAATGVQTQPRFLPTPGDLRRAGSAGARAAVDRVRKNELYAFVEIPPTRSIRR